MEHLKCECCNYIPKTKYNYIRHLKSKKHLIKSGKLDIESLLESELLESEHKQNKNEQKWGKCEHKMNKNEHKQNKNEQKWGKNEQNTHFCEYCFKTYKSRPSLIRHKKKFCKIKKEQDLQKEKDKKEIDDLKSQVNKLIDKVGNRVNITYSKINKTNNMEINNSNNNTQNIENQNIQLNNFGKENLTMLTDEVKKQMIKGPYGMFPKMLEMIYFNDKFPENKNIKLLNRKDDVLQIYDKDKGWKFVDKKETINDFLEDKGYEIDSYYDNNNNFNFNNFAKKTYKRFRELYESEDKTLWLKIRKQIDLVLWNNM
tara:strand:+ start:202 stop:1143 length:942 start_codon:yes stop_codon:yes gene_type:complete